MAIPEHHNRRQSDQGQQINEALGFIESVKKAAMNNLSGAFTTVVCIVWLWSHFMGSTAQGAAVTKADVYEIMNEKVAPMAVDLATIKTDLAVVKAQMNDLRSGNEQSYVGSKP